MAARDDVGDGEAAAGAEDAEGFGEDAVLVGGEVDDAVGDDDVDGVVREGDVLDLSLEELDVGEAGLELVLAGEGEHLVGHVEAVGKTGSPDAAGGEEDVDASAGAEVEDDLAGEEIGEGGGVAAAEAGEDGVLGEYARLIGRVEIAGDGVAAAEGGIAAGGGSGVGDGLGGAAVFLLDCGLELMLLYCVRKHICLNECIVVETNLSRRI